MRGLRTSTRLWFSILQCSLYPGCKHSFKGYVSNLRMGTTLNKWENSPMGDKGCKGSVRSRAGLWNSGILGVVLRKPGLQFRPEMPDQALNWPGSSVSQSADGMAFDLLCQLPQKVDFFGLGIALDCKKRTKIRFSPTGTVLAGCAQAHPRMARQGEGVPWRI